MGRRGFLPELEDPLMFLCHQNYSCKVNRFVLIKTFFVDVPSCYSGSGVGFLDPHKQLLPQRESSYPWYLDEHPDHSAKGINLFHKHMYISHKFCSCCTHPQEEYNHTVFRFPLRTMNSGSKLSDQPYTVERVSYLLQSLCQEAYMNLLFMKNIEHIEIQWLKKGMASPHVYFKVVVTEDSLNSNVRAQRQQLKDRISKVWHRKPLIVSIDMDISTWTPEGISQTKWAVCHSIDGGKMKTELSSIATSGRVGLLPWTGVAALRDDNTEPLAGHIFTFLPLPLSPDGRSRTGLPVHVHGHFALDHNRHNIKWPTADEKSKISDDSIRWNLLLVKETLPKAYKALLHHLKQLGSCKTIVECFPLKEKTLSPWCNILTDLYQEIAANSFFVTKKRMVENKQSWLGRWLGSHETAEKLFWVEPSEAFFIPCNDAHRNIIMKVLYQTAQNVVNLPLKVEHTLQEFQIPFLTATISDIKYFLKHESATDLLNRDEKLQILVYILQDRNYSDLEGIPLLPLADGSFTNFGSNSANAYINFERCDIACLLPGMQRRFVDMKVLRSEKWQSISDSGK